MVKLTFARGASVKDSKKLFNSSLDGNTRRAIDLREGDKIALRSALRILAAVDGERVDAAWTS